MVQLHSEAPNAGRKRVHAFGDRYDLLDAFATLFAPERDLGGSIRLGDLAGLLAVGDADVDDAARVREEAAVRVASAAFAGGIGSGGGPR
jgi:hypothetical protein